MVDINIYLKAFAQGPARRGEHVFKLHPFPKHKMASKTSHKEIYDHDLLLSAP